MMLTIGITGVGGGVGQSVIKALQHSDYRLIGMDGELLGTGLYAVDKGHKIPYANDPAYIDSLLAICRENDIRLLFPGLDAELTGLSENKEKFAAIGTTVVVSDPRVIDISEDKWSTHEKLGAMGFNVPLTFKLSGVDGSPSPGLAGSLSPGPAGALPLAFPFIVKPYLGGARSKDVYLVKNQEEYKTVLEKIGAQRARFILQEYLAGDEFTCGTVTVGGKCHGAILMKRELRFGDTYKCHSIHDQAISDYLVKLMDTMQPFGACNVQMKLKNGLPCIFEINARCSGTTAARALCGFNEPLMIADFLLKGIAPSFAIQQKTILRYWKELEVDNELVSTMKENNAISQTAPPRL